MDPKMKVLKDFNDIWAVGEVKAKTLYDQGFKSIKQLRDHEANPNKKSALTSLQKIGLQYYEDLKERFPRTEVTQMAKTV